MEIDEEVIELIAKLEAGQINTHQTALNNQEFGIYLPIYVEDGNVKLMQDGYSQSETNLKVTTSKTPLTISDDAQTVAWLGNTAGKDSSCSHSGTRSCTHCTGHTSDCRHCSGHSSSMGLGDDDLDADELDYESILGGFPAKDEIITPLAEDGFGLALLHGHNSQFKFTKLPAGFVSVISDGVTTFRPADEVSNDASFVPNIWRYLDGHLQVAGGFSAN